MEIIDLISCGTLLPYIWYYKDETVWSHPQDEGPFTKLLDVMEDNW